MRTVLPSLFVLLVASVAAWGQCDLSIDLADVTCTHVADACIGGYATHGCMSTAFEAPCTQTYYLTALISCQYAGDCKLCLAEAWVADESGAVVPNGCTHNSCGENSNCAPHQVSINLAQGERYTLYVCKLDCDDYGYDCDDCSATCSAKATVSDEP